MRFPSGATKDLTDWEAELKGEGHGSSYTLKFGFDAREFGLYWIDVIWEGEVLTSIPLMLVEKSTQSAATES